MSKHSVPPTYSEIPALRTYNIMFAEGELVPILDPIKYLKAQFST